MIEPRKICVFANIGPEIGQGHFSRSLTLAEGLAGQGASVVFVTPDNLRAADVVTAYRREHPESPIRFVPLDFALPSPVAGKPFAALPPGAVKSLPRGYGTYVVDSYRATAAQLSRLKEQSAAVAAFDDFDNRRLCPGDVDVVINPSLPAGAIDYRGLPVWSPPDYHVLSAKFFAGTVVSGSDRIILAFSGADRGQIGVRFLERLVELATDLADKFHFDLVLPCAKKELIFSPANLQKFLGKRLTVTRRYESGSAFYLNAAMLVCAGGQTLQEAQACGLPVAGVGYANDSQVKAAPYFEKCGIVTHDLRRVFAGGGEPQLDAFARALVPVLRQRSAPRLKPYYPDGFNNLVKAVIALSDSRPA